MGFNAKWELEALSNTHGIDIAKFLKAFLTDFRTLVNSVSVFRLDIADNGNKFTLRFANGELLDKSIIPSKEGFYCIFYTDYVIYTGEADNLKRRFFEDTDNTADSNKRFGSQGRAIIKYLMHHQILGDVGIPNLLVQVYPASSKLPRFGHSTFGSFYKLVFDKYRKSLEGILILVAQSYHEAMLAKAKENGFTIP